MSELYYEYIGDSFLKIWKFAFDNSWCLDGRRVG